MNKQELIEEIKNLEGLTILDKTINFDSEMIPKKEVFNIINQIDEPEKSVVPQFVADWYESRKDYFEWGLSHIGLDVMNGVFDDNPEMYDWLNNADNKPFETLVKMKLYGYEVEKEKLYTAQLKSTGEYLHYDTETDKIHHFCAYGDTAKNSKHYHFTEDTLLKYNAWGNDAYDVNEVKE